MNYIYNVNVKCFKMKLPYKGYKKKTDFLASRSVSTPHLIKNTTCQIKTTKTLFSQNSKLI